MSIGRVIFTSGQNLKPPVLCQYLIFFSDLFLTSDISFGPLLQPKNPNLKKIVDLKVYCNLKQFERERTTRRKRAASCGFGAPYRSFPASIALSNCLKTAKLCRLHFDMNDSARRLFSLVLTQSQTH